MYKKQNLIYSIFPFQWQYLHAIMENLNVGNSILERKKSIRSECMNGNLVECHNRKREKKY